MSTHPIECFNLLIRLSIDIEFANSYVYNPQSGCYRHDIHCCTLESICNCLYYVTINVLMKQ